MTVTSETTTTNETAFRPCMPGCDPQTCHDCTDQKVAKWESEMLKFDVIHTTFGEGKPEITTTYSHTLGWTTQIFGGEYNNKMWVAKTRKRADYHHRIAVEMVINFRYKTQNA
jgi:hypothetical protein